MRFDSLILVFFAVLQCFSEDRAAAKGRAAAPWDSAEHIGGRIWEAVQEDLGAPTPINIDGNGAALKISPINARKF